MGPFNRAGNSDDHFRGRVLLTYNVVMVFEDNLQAICE